MKVECPHCKNEFEVDEALKLQLEAQVSGKIKENYTKAYRELESRLKSAEQNLLETERRVKAEVKTEASQEAKVFYARTIEDLNKKIAENSDEYAKLYKQLNEANLKSIETEKAVQKKILEETERIYKEAKQKADEENRLKIEEQELKLKQTSEALKIATEKAERGSQQIQGEALEQLVERDLKSIEECRFDQIQATKSGARGADIKQVVLNAQSERCGVILWEIKHAKWQEAWIEKFKDDIAAEKANAGVIVVQDLPEKFGELGSIGDRIFAIKPRMVKPLAVLLRSKITELYNLGESRKFSNHKVEAFYDYLASGDFKSRLVAVTETYGKLKDLHEKDKKATFKRWGEYERQLDKMQLNAYSFVGELQGISDGEIGDIPLLEPGEEDQEETA